MLAPFSGHHTRSLGQVLTQLATYVATCKGITWQKYIPNLKCISHEWPPNEGVFLCYHVNTLISSAAWSVLVRLQMMFCVGAFFSESKECKAQWEGYLSGQKSGMCVCVRVCVCACVCA